VFIETDAFKMRWWHDARGHGQVSIWWEPEAHGRQCIDGKSLGQKGASNKCQCRSLQNLRVCVIWDGFIVERVFNGGLLVDRWVFEEDMFG
jgi:hypothetical protein